MYWRHLPDSDWRQTQSAPPLQSESRDFPRDNLKIQVPVFQKLPL